VTRAEAEALLANPDLIAIGMKGEEARKAQTGERVTYGRVLVVNLSLGPQDTSEAGEIRLLDRPASFDEAVSRVREARPLAGALPLTAFSLADLLALAGNDHLALADASQALREAGLESVAEAPLDGLGDTENAIEVIRSVRHGGLHVWRATIDRAGLGSRLDLIERAAIIQAETGALRAFAPLPRLDPADTPATGYDDVRTVAAARLMCGAIPAIQVDWPLYGPKLAQVAIAYGANDIDGIAAVTDPSVGVRRSPKEEIERQIRAAGATPAARNGRYEILA
jgi:aminodeoxyfutalosine synthase